MATDHAIIAGQFVGLRTLQDGTLRLTIDVPIEALAQVVNALGNGTGQPVAVARLSDADAGAATMRMSERQQVEAPGQPQRRPFDDLPPAQQAGILCNEPRFQRWAGAGDSDRAAEMVRRRCDVTSRAQIGSSPTSLKAWQLIVRSYRTDTGLEPEER